MMAKRIFISFAIEDRTYRDFLVGQARHDDTPFEFVDMSVKEPWDDSWKTRCRTRIKGCDGVIALLSKNTARAEGALWEMKCAVEEKVPVLCVHVFKDDKAPKPSVLAGTPDIEWGWNGIAAFINSL
jgi:hypothetical protein